MEGCGSWRGRGYLYKQNIGLAMGGLGMDDLVIKKMGMGVSVVLHVWLYNKAMCL